MKTNPNDPATSFTKREIIAKDLLASMAVNTEPAEWITERAVKLADLLIEALNKPVAT